MSSDRIERKRRSEFDTSDNSADEFRAVKVRRLNSVGKTVSEACKNFLNWLTPNFLKKMASRVSRQTSSSSLRMGAENNFRNQYSDDDDEEISVICMQNGTGEHSRSTSTSRMDSRFRSTKPSSSSICPLASTPYNFSLSSDDIKASRAMERRKVNGFPSMTDTGREDISRPRRSETCIAPITNPRSEIDILLEKEIEIISEVFPARHGPTRRVRLLSSPRSCKNDRNSCVGDSVYNGSQSPYSSRSYTANEVVRLQEKARYRLLLDKVVKNAPVYQPAFPREDNQISAIQIDLTDDDVPGTNCHFKKEKVEENVRDFLSKYYKPCALVPPHTAKKESELNHTQSMSEKESSIFDDDIQLLEYPELPKLRPRKPSYTLTEGFFSDAWITDLKTSISSSTEKRLKNVFEEERKVQRFKNRREARNAEEMRKREEQRLAGIIFPEDIEMDEEVFPEITPEMDAIIDAALSSPLAGDSKMCMITSLRGEEVDVTKNGLITLCKLNWLNDQVVNFYMVLIENRSQLDGYPSVHLYSSFFYTRLKQQGPCRPILRWTRKADIFSKDLIIVPLHLEMHWALLVVDNRIKTVTYYDSMGSGESHCLKLLESYFIVEMQDKKKTIVDINSYSFEIAKDIPKQMNGSDCGMFALKYAEYLTRDAPFTFTQENMPYFRRRMIYELLTKQIL